MPDASSNSSQIPKCCFYVSLEIRLVLYRDLYHVFLILCILNP